VEKANKLFDQLKNHQLLKSDPVKMNGATISLLHLYTFIRNELADQLAKEATTSTEAGTIYSKIPKSAVFKL